MSPPPPIMAGTREPGPSWRWALAMAWRDSRGSRGRLLWFIGGIVIGLAALVAVGSFRHNLAVAIERQSQGLLGADLRLTSRQAFPARVEEFARELGGETGREVRFASLAYLPDSGQTRLVRVRAVEGPFPLYGTLTTGAPEPAWRAAGEGPPPALVEEALAIPYGLTPGARLKLGQTEFAVAGVFQQAPGDNALAGLFAPRVLVNLRDVPATGLLQRGSLVFHVLNFRFPGGLDPARRQLLREAERTWLPEARVTADTVESQQRELGRALVNVTGFLNLTGLAALLLGGIGVAAAVASHLREKTDGVAVLRCLGATQRQAWAIHLWQILALGGLGAVGGTLLGVAVQQALPRLAAPLLPLAIDPFLSWPTALGGLLLGWLSAVLFALYPALRLRRVSPLRVLRRAVETPPAPWWRDAPALTVGLLQAALLLALCLGLADRPWRGVAWAAGLLAAVGLLAGVAGGLNAVLRRLARRVPGFVGRHGLANLHRPHNRTVFLVVALGLGVFLLHTLQLARHQLLAELSRSDRDGQPNLIFYDVQPDQVEGVRQTVAQAGFPVLETVPIVTMRLVSVRGVPVADLRRDPGRTAEKWVLDREYRSTWREALTPTETLLAGRLTDRWDGAGPVPVSVEEGIARQLGLALGDRVVFDVQGVPVETAIGSLRQVNWNQVRTNFFFVFPAGVLEEAPAFHALVTRSPDRAATARLQETVVRAFPNVSAIDLSLLLDTLDTLFDRAALVVQFLGLFTVGAGLAVFVATLLTTRGARLREIVLLRTLGGSGQTLRAILAVEYAALGLAAGAAGLGLSLAAGWALARFAFEVPFRVEPGAALLAVVLPPLLTTLGGGWLSRGWLRHPPLAVLREEA